MKQEISIGFKCKNCGSLFALVCPKGKEIYEDLAWATVFHLFDGETVSDLICPHCGHSYLTEKARYPVLPLKVKEKEG